MRLDVSTFPATTAAGACALTRQPGSARISTGSSAPPDAGTSGSQTTRTAYATAARVTASGQLTFPGCCGAVPAKSTTRRVSGHRDLDRDADVVVDDAVALHHVARPVPAVGRAPGCAARIRRTP